MAVPATIGEFRPTPCPRAGLLHALSSRDGRPGLGRRVQPQRTPPTPPGNRPPHRTRDGTSHDQVADARNEPPPTKARDQAPLLLKGPRASRRHDKEETIKRRAHQDSANQQWYLRGKKRGRKEKGPDAFTCLSGTPASGTPGSSTFGRCARRCGGTTCRRLEPGTWRT